MKLNFKKTTLLLSGLMAGGALFAQTPDSAQVKNYVQPFSPGSAFRTWSIGFSGGLLTPSTIFNGKPDFQTPHEQVGYGGYIKKQILPSFGIQADFLKGKLGGGVASTSATVPTSPYSRYSTELNWSASLSANFTLANISWRHNQSAIQPYLSIGGGAIAYRPTVVDATTGASTTFKPGDKSNYTEFFIPLGAGFKFNVARGVNIDLGYTVNFVNADNVDGYGFGPGNDKFSYAHAGLEFALGKSSKPQLAVHNPVSSMRYEYLAKAQSLQSQVDAEKAENERLRNDLNTTNASLAATNAKLSQDSDGDGVPDLFDKCPNTPSGVKVDGSGCPLPQSVKVYVTEEDKKVVKDAISNLEFDLGKATIRAHSLPSLDRVADLLVSKNFSLKLAGHTDNTGSAALNMRLSKERAEAIKTYLVTRGANASRIEAVGYGMTQPIASNKTAKGRQDNRRVEFTLY